METLQAEASLQGIQVNHKLLPWGIFRFLEALAELALLQKCTLFFFFNQEGRRKKKSEPKM